MAEQAITCATQRLEYLASKNRLVFWASKLYYKSIIRREVKLAGISNKDNILCIGGGPCPFSAIMLHKATGAKVTVIDNDACCVDCSAKLIERLGFSDGIKVVRQEGEEVCVNGFSLVHFAAQLSPLDQIFAAIRDRSQTGTRILIRRPKAALKKLYSFMEGGRLQGCRSVKHSPLKNLGSTVLYVKTA